MQLAKVVIASGLVLAACAEGLPEGRDCGLNIFTYSNIDSPRLHTCKIVLTIMLQAILIRGQ